MMEVRRDGGKPFACSISGGIYGAGAHEQRCRTGIASRVCAALLIFIASAGPIWAAEAFPSKPLRLIVPYPPGGGVDIVGRVFASKLAEALKHNVIVDNKPGGSATIGTGLAARAQPDGHTLLIVASTYTITPNLFNKLPYDPVRDLAAVTQVTSSAYIVVVHPSLPVATLSDLIKLAKAKPNAIAYSSPGYAGPPHLTGELFAVRTGIRILHVPNKGAGPAAIDLVSGQTQLMFSSPGVSLPYIRTNRLRALAVTTRNRLAAAPEIPTAGEAGVPDFVVDGWYGVLVPAGTPAPRVKFLSDQIAKAVQSTEVRERLLKLGIEPVGTSPDEFAQLIRAEIPRWAGVVEAARVRKGGDF
ncbi:MAG: tripartite tricarboxylate transporter substrate binding protein [Betaproteobacteria bacterium]|nr:tripartite tricarboxylate transporter substrate binding protein [Betaproteobacteria bacterium]